MRRYKVGLHALPVRLKGTSIWNKLKIIFWELRYAWKRAWLGYDDVEVFDFERVLPNYIHDILVDFKENNDSLFTDPEGDAVYTREQTNAVLDELIFLFDNCELDVAYRRVHRTDISEDGYNYEKWNLAMNEEMRCKRDAYRMLQVWMPQLWY